MTAPFSPTGSSSTILSWIIAKPTFSSSLSKFPTMSPFIRAAARTTWVFPSLPEIYKPGQPGTPAMGLAEPVDRLCTVLPLRVCIDAAFHDLPQDVQFIVEHFGDPDQEFISHFCLRQNAVQNGVRKLRLHIQSGSEFCIRDASLHQAVSKELPKLALKGPRLCLGKFALFTKFGHYDLTDSIRS